MTTDGSPSKRTMLMDTEYTYTCDGDRMELKPPAGVGLEVGLVLQRI